MKKGVLLLLGFVFLFGFVSGKNITLDYPSSVSYGQQFSIILGLQDFSGIYDVKIDVTSNNGTRISEILNNNQWKSTNYYVLSAIDSSIDNQTAFALNITKKYTGDADIVVKIRKTETTSTTNFGNFTINVQSPQEEIIVKPVENTSSVAKKTNTIPKQKTSDEKAPIISNVQNETKKELIVENYTETLGLKQTLNSEVIYESKNEKIKQYSIYGFCLFLILIIIVMIRKI